MPPFGLSIQTSAPSGGLRPSHLLLLCLTSPSSCHVLVILPSSRQTLAFSFLPTPILISSWPSLYKTWIRFAQPHLLSSNPNGREFPLHLSGGTPTTNEAMLSHSASPPSCMLPHSAQPSPPLSLPIIISNTYLLRFWFTYYKIHPFKAYNLVVFSVFLRLHYHHDSRTFSSPPTY